MSKDRKKIIYKCDCGIDYGSCGRTNIMYYTYYGVSDTFKLGVKYHIDEIDSKITHITGGTDNDLDVLTSILSDAHGNSNWSLNEIEEFDKFN